MVTVGGPETFIASCSMVGGYSPSRRAATVEFPELDEPTNAVHLPFGTIMFRSERAGASGRPGYQNVRCETSMGPDRVCESCGFSFSLPQRSGEVRNGSLANRSKRDPLSALDAICGTNATAVVAFEVLERSRVKTSRIALTENSWERATSPPYQKISAVTKWILAPEAPKKNPQYTALRVPILKALLVAFVYFL